MMQKFSWGPETYALFFVIGIISLYLSSSPPTTRPASYIPLFIIACSCLLLCYRIFERINRCTLILQNDGDSRSKRILEIRSRFGRTRFSDVGTLIFEAPHSGYIVCTMIMWGAAAIILMLLALDPSDAFCPPSRRPCNFSTSTQLSFALMAILCAAMVANVFRTKVVLFRCCFSRRGLRGLIFGTVDKKYISWSDAQCIALAAVAGQN
jgi:hypothetical protein